MRGPRNKLLARLQPLHQHVQLIIQPLPRGSALVGFACDARHRLRGEARDSDRGEDVAELGDKVGFYGLDGDVIYEAFECDLARRRC